MSTSNINGKARVSSPEQAEGGDLGESDLGLQGLHLENTPPKISPTRILPSPTEKGHTLQILKSRFGSHTSMRKSSSSSYFSARDVLDQSRTASSSPLDSPGGLQIEGMDSNLRRPKIARAGSSSESPSSFGKSSKMKNRLPRLQSTASDSNGQQMLEGSNLRSTLSSPKATSSLSNSPASPLLFARSRRRSSHRVEMKRKSSNTAGEMSPIGKSDLLTPLIDGSSSTGLILSTTDRTHDKSLRSPTTPTDAVSIPGRRTSLRRRSRGRSVSDHALHSPPLKDSPPNIKSKGSINRISKVSEKRASMAPDIQANFQRWVLSVGCVNFDLDKGPDLEFLSPSLGISREERDNIAFSSFPDTSIFDDGQAVFSWRVREVPLDSSISKAPIIASQFADLEVSRGSSPEVPFDAQKRASTLPPPNRSNSHNNNSNANKIWTIEKGRMQQDRFSTSNLDHSHLGQIRSDLKQNVTGQKRPSHSPISTRPSSSSDMILQRHASNYSSSSSAWEDTSLSSHQQNGDGPSICATAAPSEEGHTMKSSTIEGKSSRSSNFIHGYCFFRQKRDASIRRGYFQKSVVILSHLPYVSLFSEIVQKLGPLFFEIGMPALEAFAQDVQNWPPPEPSARLHLPLMGSVLSVDLPYHSQFQTSLAAEARIVKNLNVPGKARSGLEIKATNGHVRKGSEEEPILASIPSTPLFDIFRECLDDLWLLWECLLLADPILVVGPDPCLCSEAVWHMLDLVRPIPFAGDFRPFFTIHDYDFKTLVTKNKPNAGIILGVTNPFMLQACKHWPNILKVGKGAVKSSKHILAHRKAISTSTLSSPSMNSNSNLSGGGGGGGGGIAGGNHAGGGGPEHVPGLISKRKRRISKDRQLMRKLHEIAEKGTDEDAANAMLRRYFSDLTERFLAPLNRYVNSLIPADFDLSSPTETPKVKPFNTTAFLASLKVNGTPLPIRSRNLPTGAAVRQSLYLEFLQCPNFSLWLHERVGQLEEEQYNRKLQALECGNIVEYVKIKGELETIDLYSRLKTEIQQIDVKLISNKKERELEPNSRWKSASPSKIKKTTLYENSPALAMSAEGLDNKTEAKIKELIRSSGNMLTSGEKSLLNKKVHLIRQLDTLVKLLPHDLRDSLELKHAGARQEAMGSM